ncbi:unnamed protein product [Ixodes persulcatus]
MSKPSQSQTCGPSSNNGQQVQSLTHCFLLVQSTLVALSFNVLFLISGLFTFCVDKFP